MKRYLGKIIPALLCVTVILAVATLQWSLQTNDSPGWLQALEGMTFDWRVKKALAHPTPIATNLGVIVITEDTIKEVRSGKYGFEADLYWPRHVYGRLVQELDAQGVEAVAFDVLFAGLRSGNETAKFPDGTTVTSDHFLALQLSSAGNVILAAQVSENKETVFPPRMFKTAWAVGDITAEPDADSVFRRAKAFHDYVVWHEMIDEAARKFDGFDVNTNRIRFRTESGEIVEIPIATDRTADLATLRELGNNRKPPSSPQRREQAFTRYRAWNLGITAAARRLNLDLEHAGVEPGRQIVLRNTNGFACTIPIDRENRFLIDWSIPIEDRRFTRETFHGVLQNWFNRSRGLTNELKDSWRGKLAFVGSLAAGNDLRDVGPTPLGPRTFLTACMWNIANSVLTGRFIRQSPLMLNLVLIGFLGLIGSWVTSQSRTLTASLTVLLLAVVYSGVAFYAYFRWRFWLPMVLPLAALVFTHFALLTYRVVFEQKERRRIRNVFARMVSPNIVSELLQAENLSLVGARREVTVFFSDVRGFTALTDKSHARAEEYVRQHKLSGPEAVKYFDTQAEEVLATVNQYLSAIAKQVQAHAGTLDKYIGDCVMAFWGAPTLNTKHAAACVRAAIDAQRAIAQLNIDRTKKNPLLEPLYMGSGINTGTVNIGLMGSEANSTYTVFGREVNLASRLEHFSERRIVISKATYEEIQREKDEELAASCRKLEDATLKGFDTPVEVYEVLWAPRVDSEPVAEQKSPK